MDKWGLERKLAKYFDSNQSFKDHCFIIVLLLHTGQTVSPRRDGRLVAHWWASSQGEVGAVGWADCRLGELRQSQGWGAHCTLGKTHLSGGMRGQCTPGKPQHSEEWGANSTLGLVNLISRKGWGAHCTEGKPHLSGGGGGGAHCTLAKPTP